MIKKITSLFTLCAAAFGLNAAVQFTDFSPSLSMSLSSGNNVIDLDIDGNSTYDLSFLINGTSTNMYNISINGNDVDILVDQLNTHPNRSYATALFAGSSVAPGNSAWANANANRQIADDAVNSDFQGQGERFIGFRFKANGQRYYGWVLVELSNAIEFKVKSFAVESSPNKAITVGYNGNQVISLQEEKLADFSFYPTEVQSELNIASENRISQVDILNLAGSKVFSTAPNSKSATLPLGHLNAGIYIARVRDIHGNTSSRKFVKRN